MGTYAEILEQPDCLRRLLENQRIEVERVAAEIKKRDIRFIFLAARGTSDNAGRYANYLLGGINGLPVALATPSLFTYYQNSSSTKRRVGYWNIPIRSITGYCKRHCRRPPSELPHPGIDQRSQFPVG